MVLAVDKRGLDVDQRESSQRTVLHGVLDAGVDRRNVLLRHATTGNGVLELVGRGLALFQLVRVGRVRLQRDDDLSELTRTTGLLLVGVFVLLNGLADGLTVRNLRGTHVRLNLEFALHAVNKDVEVELAHTTDDGLAGLFVELDGECRVFFSEALNSEAELLLVSLGLRLDGHLNNRVWEVHGLQNDLVIGVT